MDLLEKEFERYPGQTLRACLSLASQWRTTKQYARMSASLLVADKDITVQMDGAGNCIEIEGGVSAIGSGGLYALSAARGMIDNDDLCAQ